MNATLVSARFMLLSSLGFALMGVCVKLAGEQGVPLMQIIAARAFISLLISGAILKQQGIAFLGQQKFWLAMRGITGTLALMCVYYSVLNIPYAEATVIQYLNPLFTACLAALVLHEKLHAATVIALLVSFIGLLLVMQPEMLFADNKTAYATHYYLFALLGAIISAVAYVIVRHLTATENANVIIFYFPLIALPVSLLWSWNNFIIPDAYTGLLLVLVGVFTQIGQWGITKGMQFANAGKAMSFSYIQIVFAFVLGVVVFNEVPTLIAFMGMALIVIATLMSLLFTNRQ